jgi:hypothetical protein
MSDQLLTPTKLPHLDGTRHQRGYAYEPSNAFPVRHYTTEIVNGVPERKQKSHRLCSKDRATGHGSRLAKAVLSSRRRQTVQMKASRWKPQ